LAGIPYPVYLAVVSIGFHVSVAPVSVSPEETVDPVPLAISVPPSVPLLFYWATISVSPSVMYPLPT
jgi:hypothetical protein